MIDTIANWALQLLSKFEALHPDLVTLTASLLLAAVLLWAVTWILAAKTYKY